MRPQITFPKSLKRALNYHEKKVQKGAAELLHAHNFFKLPRDLNFYDKEQRFKDLMALHETAQTKLIHISLNFHPSEKERLDKTFLIHLADEYMHKIGFGDQPYLVYQHDDAGHPHIHVLSPLIQEDGVRISTHFIGKNVSEPVRKEMEKQYGFIPADKKEQTREEEKQLAITPQKIQAGKSATTRSITNVLDHVIDRYKYTSIHELNAVLRLYNVKADRGSEDGRIYKHRGLTYVVIDKEGKTLTKPLKASIFHSKPTLDYIEEKCKKNEKKRLPDKKHIKTAIDWAMQSGPGSMAELAKLLKRERIDLVVRRNEQGRVFGMTFIDHVKKTVFNGSDIDKEYAAKKMMERLGLNSQLQQEKELQKQQTKANKAKADEKEPANENLGKSASKIIEQVVDPDSGESWAINKEMLTEEQRKKKKGFTKQWEI
ncbi:relaxase/mobilization nuclease domain-containing protein [Niabella beijingensis]|uniref:relaxase/mobilization nuclease domain-containing protein n=1 Tax=Niabella beijingensis TaxID=2872700 RepID=UPI001CBAECE3|nr:relaxase/mobilization nuclease domain-containing protein [Niabella beijingensis]MBZ4187674.1 relaxase/mobilization nuclease domain-containing protein [Niabella beijingensis]